MLQYWLEGFLESLGILAGKKLPLSYKMLTYILWWEQNEVKKWKEEEMLYPFSQMMNNLKRSLTVFGVKYTETIFTTSDDIADLGPEPFVSAS